MLLLLSIFLGLLLVTTAVERLIAINAQVRQFRQYKVLVAEDIRLNSEAVSITPRVTDVGNRSVRVAVSFRNQTGYPIVLCGLMIDYLVVKGSMGNLESIALDNKEHVLPANHRDPLIVSATYSLPTGVDVDVTTGLRVSATMTRHRLKWTALTEAFTQLEVKSIR
jgi:hypothetical protein